MAGNLRQRILGLVDAGFCFADDFHHSRIHGCDRSLSRCICHLAKRAISLIPNVWHTLTESHTPHVTVIIRKFCSSPNGSMAKNIRSPCTAGQVWADSQTVKHLPNSTCVRALWCKSTNPHETLLCWHGLPWKPRTISTRTIPTNIIYSTRSTMRSTRSIPVTRSVITNFIPASHLPRKFSRRY